MILVTGASGFIGSAVLGRAALDAPGRLRGAVRRPVALPAGVDVARVGDLGPDTDWDAALAGVEAIVHTAARVHVMRETAASPLELFREVNVAGTLHLARRAARAGVRRLVFISSIKVNGEATRPGRPFTAGDVPAPLDAYGVSKDEAERGLRELAQDTGMEVVIIRPVLVYGPGVKANFASMMNWLYRGVPLPLGAIRNRRSLVAVGNLVDLVMCCLHHPAAANRTFFVSDGEDVSTTDLLRRTAAALGRPARLLPVPAAAIELAARLAGRGEVARRICGSLQVDISEARSVLGWTPPIAMDEALRQTARHFLASRS